MPLWIALAEAPHAAPLDGQFSWNLLADAQEMLSYYFMQHAFLAGTLVACVAGAVGYFMVLRGESFAGHTLANVGFAGAAGAVLLGVAPVVGLLVFGVCAALAIGALGGSGTKGRGHTEVAIGTILALSLGLGLLFERLASVSASGIYSVLFGAVLGVSDADIATITVTAAMTLGTLICIGRPLLFASIDPDVAAARGVPVRLLTYAFLVILAFTVAQAVQVVGILLIFALLVTPAATAQQLTARPVVAMGLSVMIALLVTWLGLAIAYYTPYPVGFFVTTFAFAAYVCARLWRFLAGYPLGGSGSQSRRPIAAAAPQETGALD
jgi:zinc/manganese transport system permease protein